MASTWELDRRAMYDADADFISSRVADTVVPLADNRYVFYISFMSCTVGSNTITLDKQLHSYCMKLRLKNQ